MAQGRSGRSVPGYVIEARIGGGGAAEVFRARVAGSQERVALKRIAVEDADAVRAARAEAALLATLDHPNLVRLHEVVAQPDAVVLVLDLAAGGSLFELVRARGRLTVGETVAALAPVAAALAAAHAEGITHGDVTPANILFTEIGLPLLSDLGVARLIGDSRSVHSTPAFVDPVVANGAIPCPSSDVFMLAATTVFALTGEVLWPGADSEAVLALARTGRVAVGAALERSHLPGQLVDLLHRALSLEPQRRGDAARFAMDLRSAATPIGIELSAGRARATAVPLPPAGTPRRRWARAASAPAARYAPRHAAVPAEDGVAAQVPDAGDAPEPAEPAELAGPTATPTPDESATISSRPDFGRPALTYGLRPPPITAIGGRRQRWLRALAVRRVALGVAVLAVAALGAVGVRIAAGGGSGGHASRVAAARPATPTLRTPATTPAAATADPVAALRRLAALRQRAFADRDPALLAQVYVAGPLLQADTDMLTTVVPSGCGLRGARPVYASVSVLSSTSARTELTAEVSVPASTLSCGGRVTGHAPAVPAARMRIVLVHRGDGERIAAQQALS